MKDIDLVLGEGSTVGVEAYRNRSTVTWPTEKSPADIYVAVQKILGLSVRTYSISVAGQLQDECSAVVPDLRDDLEAVYGRDDDQGIDIYWQRVLDDDAGNDLYQAALGVGELPDSVRMIELWQATGTQALRAAAPAIYYDVRGFLTGMH